MAQDHSAGWQIRLDDGACIGSGLCLGIAPEHFATGPDHRTVVRLPVVADKATVDGALTDAVDCCPVEAITVVPMGDAAAG